MDASMWEQYLGYERDTLRYFIIRCGEVSVEQFHQQFDIGHGTLYDTLVHIIENLETWTDLMRERTVRALSAPAHTADECLARFESAMTEFAGLVRDLTAAGQMEGMYTDVLDNPPVHKSFSATILHLLTHTTVHRWEMQHMLQRLGLKDLIEGDALGWDRRRRDQKMRVENSLAATQAILFDLDGTLLDTSEFMFRAFEHTFEQYGVNRVSREHLARMVGGPLEGIYERIAPDKDPDRLADTHRSFQEENLQLAVTFPHVANTLEALRKRGLRMAVVTTRSRRTSVRTLEYTGLDRFFEVVISGEDVTRLKPDPEPLILALNKLEIAPERAVMVGDTRADVVAGQQAGTRTVGVTYGFGGSAIGEHAPDYVIDDIEGLLQIITG